MMIIVKPAQYRQTRREKNKMTVFSNEKRNHLESKAFLDGGVNIQRYDAVKYRQFDKFTDKQLGFFWRPEEVDIGKDQ